MVRAAYMLTKCLLALDTTHKGMLNLAYCTICYQAICIVSLYHIFQSDDLHLIGAYNTKHSIVYRILTKEAWP